MGWNWRSLNSGKLEFTKFLLNKYNPDVTVIWEIWLNKPLFKDTKKYECHQTEYSTHQGVCIISKIGLVLKVWKNKEQYFITVQWGTSNPVFIIGAYFKKEKRREILSQIKQIINRIRKVYNNPNILLFWDLNPWGKFTVKTVEKELNLSVSEINKNLIIIKQRRLNEVNESWLQFNSIFKDKLVR